MAQNVMTLVGASRGGAGCLQSVEVNPVVSDRSIQLMIKLSMAGVLRPKFCISHLFGEGDPAIYSNSSNL